MKTTQNLLLVLFINCSLSAQNLVPNPSFEDTFFCPQFYSEIGNACEHWLVFKESPDYMHTCNPILSNDLTNGKLPHTGEAFAGFLTYGITTPNILREQIGIQLASPLVIGEKYFVSFFVSLAYVSSIANIATNNVGALFTTYPYYDPMLEIPNINFSHINETSIISDTIWVKISGAFIADSSYTHMVIGNFYDDIFTDTLNLPYTVAQQRAYYCVDDVCVTTDSLYNEMWTGVVTTVKKSIDNINHVICYPNPANDVFNIKSDDVIRSIELYNCLGNRVLFIDHINSHLRTITVNQYTSGYYFLKVNTLNKNQFIKITIH
jgi:hypothetical protein